MSEIRISPNFLSILRKAELIMVSTGAGISTESGVPAFRGPGGLWNDFNPEEYATPEAFVRDPAKVWEWYDWRRQLLREVKPNAGHYALAELEKLVPKMFLFTQNIDGLHQKAGSKNVYELHGNIWRVRCTKENRNFPLLEAPLKQSPPRCECNALLRPDVVWFGEMLPEEILELAWKVAAQSDLFLLIGSSATVQPAASLVWVAKEKGAFIVEINPENTAVSDVADVSFRANSGSVLPQILENFKNCRSIQ